MSSEPQHIPALREQDLAGKVAVVTGGTRGIGRATALNLASRGCSVLVTCSSTGSLRHADTLSHSITDLYKGSSTTAAPKITGLVADIGAPSTPAAIADALEKDFGGRVDILVNNASMTSTAAIGEMSNEHISSYLAGNIETPVKLIEQFVQRRLFRPNSRIIFISSVRARKGWGEQTMYMATKSATESLARSYAHAFGGKDARFSFMAGTTANAVMVGLTKTDSVYNNPAVPKDVIGVIEGEFVPAQAIPRVGMPEDVADVVGVLCREESRWITGSVVSADGGGVAIL